MDQLHMLVVLVWDILVINLPILCKRIITVNPEVANYQFIPAHGTVYAANLLWGGKECNINAGNSCCSQTGMPWLDLRI